LTIKGFEWKPLEVLSSKLRKKIQRKKLSSRESSREKDSASRWA
jgi:hypothetical protein